jgi:hypothetical protein
VRLVSIRREQAPALQVCGEPQAKRKGASRKAWRQCEAPKIWSRAMERSCSSYCSTKFDESQVRSPKRWSRMRGVEDVVPYKKRKRRV